MTAHGATVLCLSISTEALACVSGPSFFLTSSYGRIFADSVCQLESIHSCTAENDKDVNREQGKPGNKELTRMAEDTSMTNNALSPTYEAIPNYVIYTISAVS